MTLELLRLIEQLRERAKDAQFTRETRALFEHAANALTRPTPAERPDLPLAVRLRDEEGPPLPQMVAQRREQLAQQVERPAGDKIDMFSAYKVVGYDRTEKMVWVAFPDQLTAEPSRAAVSLPRFFAGRSDNDNPRMSVLVFGEPLTVEHHREIAHRVASRAIPHKEAGRVLLKREAEKYAGYSDKPVFSGKHVANILQTALALTARPSDAAVGWRLDYAELVEILREQASDGDGTSEAAANAIERLYALLALPPDEPARVTDKGK